MVSLLPREMERSTMPVTKGGDSIIHPPHYNDHPSGVECWDIVRWMGFNLGNAMKYIWRDGLKDTQVPLEDLKKARNYIDDEIKLREGVYGQPLPKPSDDGWINVPGIKSVDVGGVTLNVTDAKMKPVTPSNSNRRVHIDHVHVMVERIGGGWRCNYVNCYLWVTTKEEADRFNGTNLGN